MREELLTPYPTTGYLAGARVRHIMLVSGRKDSDYQASIALCGASPATNKNKPRDRWEWTDQWLGHGGSSDYDRMFRMKVCGVCASKVAKFNARMERVLTLHLRPVRHEEEEEEENE